MFNLHSGRAIHFSCEFLLRELPRVEGDIPLLLSIPEGSRLHIRFKSALVAISGAFPDADMVRLSIYSSGVGVGAKIKLFALPISISHRGDRDAVLFLDEILETK